MSTLNIPPLALAERRRANAATYAMNIAAGVPAAIAHFPAPVKVGDWVDPDPEYTAEFNRLEATEAAACRAGGDWRDHQAVKKAACHDWQVLHRPDYAAKERAWLEANPDHDFEGVSGGAELYDLILGKWRQP